MKGRNSKRVVMTPEQQTQARIEAHLRAEKDYEIRNRRMLEAKRRAEDGVHIQFVRLQAKLDLASIRDKKFRSMLRD